jgi:hypothetical protein
VASNYDEVQYFETQYHEALAHAHTFWMDNFRKKNAKEALYRTFDLSNV